MSMLSAQCDELRERADAFEGYQNGEISRLMREAADTIWGLRDRAQALQAENAKLREMVRTMVYAVNPLDRERFLVNAAELGVEVGG